MDEIKISKIKFWKGVVLVLIILFIASILTNNFKGREFDIGKNKAEEKTLNFLNLILQEKNKVEITDINEENGLYRLSINLDGQNFSAYLSKDGKLFFPSSINLDKANLDLANNNTNLNNIENIEKQ